MNDTYTTWKNHLSGTTDGRLLDLMSQDEVSDAFSGDISFGTGGLRGVMGLGSNRMNSYTVERVTHGLAKVVMESESPKSVAIAFDTRHNSSRFSETVCALLSVYGITVYTFDKPMPTPALSFAIRHLKLGWGVVITASHNPKEYNGYKVYNDRGVQLTDEAASMVTSAIEATGFFKPAPDGRRAHIIAIGSDVETAYREQIISFAQRDKKAFNYPFVYSALHGTGANVIPLVLEQLGFSPRCIQQTPDGDFGGLMTPNPEEPSVYAEAIEEAEKCGARFLCATDPDCDRVGVMVKTTRGFEPLTGNQLGALLIDYLAQTRGVSPGDTVITTIVSGMLGEYISKSYGLDFVRLLTGFKYIGEYTEHLPKGKRFFFGYEESYGFLAGDGARDKDAVIATALIALMVDFYDKNGMTLLGRWSELSEKYGFCLEALHSLQVPQSKQKKIMDKLRSGVAFDGLVKAEDYMPGLNGLPPSNVLKLYFESGGWAAIRPSGTEPKIKLYTGVCEKTHAGAKASLESLNDMIMSVLEV